MEPFYSASLLNSVFTFSMSSIASCSELEVTLTYLLSLLIDSVSNNVPIKILKLIVQLKSNGLLPFDWEGLNDTHCDNMFPCKYVCEDTMYHLMMSHSDWAHGPLIKNPLILVPGPRYARCLRTPYVLADHPCIHRKGLTSASKL